MTPSTPSSISRRRIVILTILLFLHEVRRVAPGGHLLYADFRGKGRHHAALQGDVERSGMAILEEEDISRGVVLGMQRNHDKYTALIQRLVPWPLSKAAKRSRA